MAVTHLTFGSLEIRQNLDAGMVGTPPQYVISPMGSNVEVTDFPKTWNWHDIISTALCDCSWPQSELSSTGDQSIVGRYLELQITGGYWENLTEMSMGADIGNGETIQGSEIDVQLLHPGWRYWGCTGTVKKKFRRRTLFKYKFRLIQVPKVQLREYCCRRYIAQEGPGMWLKVVWHCFSEDVNKYPLTLDRQPLTNQSQVLLTPKVHCDEPMSSIGSGNDSRQLYHQKPRAAWKAGKTGIRSSCHNLKLVWQVGGL